MSDKPVIVPSEAALTALTPASMPQLFAMAIQRGQEGVEMLERLVALEERVCARRAAQEFADAMSRFKATCPAVPRRTENTQFKVSRAGVMVARRYASLEDIEATIRGPAGDCGLSFRWGDGVIVGGIMTLPCIVSHIGGHSVSSSVQMPLESKAGCSEQQKYGITYAYLQRYSLINAFGLTSCDEDMDGNEPSEDQKLSKEQVEILESLLDKRPSGSRAKFMVYCNVLNIEEIPASRFAALKADLEKKIAAQ